MSDTVKDVRMDCLFKGRDVGVNVLNVKFFRGSNASISKEQLKEEMRAASDRKRSGEVKYKPMPKWRGGKVDLHARVAKV